MPSTTHFDLFYSKAQVLDHVQTTGDHHAADGELYSANASGRPVASPILEPAMYLTSVSVDAASSTIHTIGDIGGFARRFPFLADYTIDCALPGQGGSFRASIGEPLLMFGAPLKPTFFDAQLCNIKHLTCYNRTNAVPGFLHSGDLRENKNGTSYFVHTIKMMSAVSGVYVASAVGYSHNPLHKFQEANPFILLINHDRRVMIVVPFSLEKASIGESMLIAPLVFKITPEGQCLWYIPETCATDGRVNTGDYSASFRQKVEDLNRTFDAEHTRCVESHDGDAGVETTVATPPLANDTIDGVARVVFVQSGLAVEDDASTVFARFGTSLDIRKTPPTDSTPPTVVLPILTGSAHGHAALALGVAATGLPFSSSDAWRAFLAHCSVRVDATDGPMWIEAVLQSLTHRLNGLMVVHTSRRLSDNQKDRVAQMTALKVCAARLMTSTSLIVLASDSRFFFYRGPLALYHPTARAEFGDVVAPDLLRLTMHHPLGGAAIPFADQRVVASDGAILDNRVALEDALVSAAADENATAWSILAAQTTIVLSSAEIDELKARLHTRLLAAETAPSLKQRLRSEIEQLQRRLTNAPAGVDIVLHAAEAREAVLRTKTAIRDEEAPLRAALGRVDTLCSMRVASARSIGVQQIQRKLTVQKNVARATQMTAQELSTELGQFTWGFAVARVDEVHAVTLLNAISSNQMDTYLQQLATPSDPSSRLLLRDLPFIMTPNCPMLDNDSIGVLMGHDQATHHVLRAMGKELTFTMQGIAHLVLPLYNSYEALDGSYVPFMDECNIPCVADFRVALRHMLSNLNSRIPISPASPNLTLGIVTIVLSLLYSIVSEVRSLDALHADDTKCQTIRALFYLWGTFAASGQKPVTFAYQLLQPGAVLAMPRLRGEWTLYAVVTHCYPYTKLPMDGLHANVRRLLVDVLFLFVTKATRTKKGGASTGTPREDALRVRNDALRWNFAACAVVNRFDRAMMDGDTFAAAATRLLGTFPAAPTFTSAYLRLVFDRTVRGEASTINWPFVRKVVACATIKRSGAFAAAKRTRLASALQKAARAAKEKLGVDAVVPQNASAYEQGDVMRMKGDAELRRIPWRVSAIATGESNDDFLARMVGSLLASTHDAENVAASVVAYEDTRVARLTPKAAALFRQARDGMGDMRELDKTIPLSCLGVLARAVAPNQPTQSVVCDCICHLLVALDDGHSDETIKNMAVARLCAARDGDTAVSSIEVN